MNRKRSIKEILSSERWSYEKVIQTLLESESDIWILPELYESTDGQWHQPDLALVRNREGVIKDIERKASHCFVKFYLGIHGKRVGGSPRDQHCLLSDLFVDSNFLEIVKNGAKREDKGQKLFVNNDCSFIRVDGKGFRLEGHVRACIFLFVRYWRKGIRELPVADILLELNLDQTLHLRKLFRGYNNKRVYDALVNQTRHGHYALSISSVEDVLDESVVGPIVVQSLSTLNQ